LNKTPCNQRRITVVGAGIVGISCALNLLRDGHAVTVVDRAPPGEGCSQGNAGMFSSDSFIPLSIPGVLGQVPGWLLDPFGPLAIRWRHLPSMVPWLVRFVLAGRPRRVEEICAALAPLLASSLKEHRALARGTEAEGLIRAQGCLYVYEDAKSLAKEAKSWDLQQAHGTVMERLGGAEIREREPALASVYQHGYFLPEMGHTVEPMLLVKALAGHFEQSGGVIVQREVLDIEAGPDGPRRLATDRGALDVDVLVIAAGAFSGRLTAKLGSPVPLQGERGYHVTIGHSGIHLNAPVFVSAHKFIATPMTPGIRIAGTAEFGGLDAAPNFARARALTHHARKMLPGIDTTDVTEWSGLRPTLPDSLPVIGPSPHLPNLFFAFGHQHVGLTGGPKTGRLIADLVAGRTPGLDLGPFRADRF